MAAQLGGEPRPHLASLSPRQSLETASLLITATPSCSTLRVERRKFDAVAAGEQRAGSRSTRATSALVRERRWRPRYPFVWLDGKTEKVREHGAVRQECVLIAYAVHESDDEWLLSRRYLSQESLSAVLDRDDHTHER